MSATATILLLWLAFGLTHSPPTGARFRLAARLGERGYRALYSIVALVLFVLLVRAFNAHRHEGMLLYDFGDGFALRGLVYLLMAIALVLVVGGFVRPSPASLRGGGYEPHGALRLTRHPVFMGFALFGLAHLLANGYASDVAFFGGFVVYSIVGAWHQDRRKLAIEGEAYRRFVEATPLLPFAGPGRGRALREMPLAVAVGLAATVALRLLHPRLFG